MQSESIQTWRTWNCISFMISTTEMPSIMQSNGMRSRIEWFASAIPMWYLIGDMMENVIPSSKGDIFGQTASSQEQKEWLTDQLLDLKDKTICVLDGNHERNRSTKAAGLYPLYDCSE